MIRPFVSAIMPSYNQAVYIKEAIASVLSQSYLNLELILMPFFYFMWVSHVYYLISTYGFNTLKFKSPVSKKTTIMKFREVLNPLAFDRVTDALFMFVVRRCNAVQISLMAIIRESYYHG